MTAKQIFRALAAALALASIGCAGTMRQHRATCAIAYRQNFDPGGANPCGYDAGSQAAEPSGP
ncbi:MAG TPA: hypothetical protein VFF06_03630 [Polyangia bacterium]|nr:hypothetical protein [Polyangia bacterium]